MPLSGTIRSVPLLMTILGAAGVFGVSESDYQRAASLSGRFRDKVFGERLEPHWAKDGGRFWYKFETGPDTHEFIVVNAAEGTRQPAFDHSRLAAALSKAQSDAIKAESLPLEKVEFDWEKPAMQFQCGGFLWACDLTSYELRQLGAVEEESLPAFDPQRAPRGSVRTGSETLLIFVNRTEKEVELFWLDPTGQRQSYAILQPGQQHQQHTYAGHVWLAAEKDGRDLAIYVAAEQKARALIGVEAPRPVRQRAEERRGRRSDRYPRAISPDGKWRAFIREHNLWIGDPNDGNEIQLTTEGTPQDAFIMELAWSPNSRKLAVMRQQPEEEHKIYLIESSPADQVQPKLHTINYNKPGFRAAVRRPYLFDIETKKSIPVSSELFADPYSLNDLRWAPDSSRFTVVYNQRGHQVLRVVAVDTVTGQTTAIVDEKSDTFICYSGKYFCEFLDDTGEILWMSERDGWNHLYLYDSKTGRVKNQITKGQWVVRSVEHIDKDKRQIWFRAGGIHPGQDPYYLHYARVNFDGSGLTIFTDGDGTHAVQFSPDRRFCVDTWSRVNHAPVHELRRCEDGKLVCALERADLSALLKEGWQAPEPFVAKGRDGQTDIYGVIIRPTVFDPNLKYPVIENIYAGPQDSFVPKSFSSFYRMMELAEVGFILVQIDGLGTSNRSKAFHDVCWKNLADAGLPDRILWIKAAAQKYPYLDIERVGIYGGSAGGQNAAAAVMTHGDFYKAAVADCGCHDNRMDKSWWNEQWMGYPVGPEYAANSNVTLAAGLSGKLLLISGEMDTNVDPASTMQVVNALIKADKDFEMLIIPGAGHGAGDSPYGARRRRDFFVRHLK